MNGPLRNEYVAAVSRLQAGERSRYKLGAVVDDVTLVDRTYERVSESIYLCWYLWEETAKVSPTMRAVIDAGVSNYV